MHENKSGDKAKAIFFFIKISCRSGVITYLAVRPFESCQGGCQYLWVVRVCPRLLSCSDRVLKKEISKAYKCVFFFIKSLMKMGVNSFFLFLFIQLGGNLFGNDDIFIKLLLLIRSNFNVVINRPSVAMAVL